MYRLSHKARFGVDCTLWSIETLPAANTVSPPGQRPGSFKCDMWQPLTRLAALVNLSPLRGARWFQVSWSA